MFMGNVNPHAIKGHSTLKANGFSNSKKVIKLFIEFIKNISIALRFKQGNINHFFLKYNYVPFNIFQSFISRFSIDAH